MKTILSLAFLLIFTAQAWAAGISTGSDLLKACASTQPSLSSGLSKSGTEAVRNIQAAGACVNFLMGFDSGQSIVALLKGGAGTHCQPEGANIGDMVNSVVSFLSTDKEFAAAPAGIAAWKALSAAWPCE